MCSAVYGIATMDPSLRSWSSVNSSTMFFCVPGVTLGGSGGGGSGGSGGVGGCVARVPMTRPAVPICTPGQPPSTQQAPLCANQVQLRQAGIAAHTAQQPAPVVVTFAVPTFVAFGHVAFSCT